MSARRLGRTLEFLVRPVPPPHTFATRVRDPEPAVDFHWPAKPMGTPLIDIEDKEALWDVLDRRD